MRIRRILLCLILACPLSSGISLAQPSRFRVLAFYSDKTEPDHVEFAENAVKFLTDRAAREHFALEVTTSWKDLNDARLKDCQLVIWLNESPSNTDARHAFERYMESGGAWLGFHAAAYNDKDTKWPWYVDFLGGTVFASNSWPPLPARLRVDDPEHPVMSGIPHAFESPANEWYVWNPSPRVNKDVRVLASLSPSNYPIGLKDVLIRGDLPVVWTNTKYRMLYINMGHGDKIFSSSAQNQLIDNAFNWLGTGAAAGQVSESIGRRISPNGIAVNPQTGKFYAVNTAENTVTVLDGDANFKADIKVGKAPEAIAINPETNRVYVANQEGGDVTVIDGATDQAIATVPVGDLPYTIAANPATNKVYVSRTFSDVTVIIDGNTNRARTMKAGVGDAVAATSVDGDAYLVSYEAPYVTVFDGHDDRASKVATPNHVWAMAANPVTKKIYAASIGSGVVTVINGKSHATNTVKAGEMPCGIAIDSGSGKVFVANYESDDVTVIDGGTDSVVRAVRVVAHPQAIGVDSGNHRVYVASMHDGTATIIDGAKGSVMATVNVGRTPFAIAVNAETHKAVVLGLGGELTVIDGASLATSPITSIEKHQ